MRPHPHLYANALVFLRRLSKKYGRQLTLASIPEEEWQHLRRLGFDLLWLMGVWERSLGSRQIALGHPGLRSDYEQALPDWTEADVVGSPYAVHSYKIDPRLGEDGELLDLKSTLNRHGLGLVLDFVPNHLALDHPWTLAHPNWFVGARGQTLHEHPDWYFLTKGGIYLAHGRDPYFPPWTDTVQVNFYSPELRAAWLDELIRIAEVADGVRCDMAMLGLNDVFQQVWGEVVGGHSRPESEFWSDAIQEVKQKHSEFIFIAEAYWGLEQTLLDLGFDYTYDKALYDRLRHSGPIEVQDHIEKGTVPQARLVRFIENHDEARAVTAFGRERSMAAATLVVTLPGLRLFHDGQLEGKLVRLPIQLGREPDEVPDVEIFTFYHRLLTVCDSPTFHEGEWSLLEAEPAWRGNPSHQDLLAWTWDGAKEKKIVVVNFAPNVSQGRLRLPHLAVHGSTIVLNDELHDIEYIRDPGELQDEGLYMELGPWQANILDVTTG
jgi:glycosidase